MRKPAALTYSRATFLVVREAWSLWTSSARPPFFSIFVLVFMLLLRFVCLLSSDKSVNGLFSIFKIRSEDFS